MEPDHLLRHRRYGFADSLLGFVPILSSHAGDAGSITACVLLHGSQLIGRHIQAIVGGVSNDEIVPLDSGHGLGHKALESADAMPVMHHVVAGGEVRVAD